MLDKLNIIKERFDEVSKLIIEPEIISDQKKYIKLNREYKELNLIMVKRDEYLALLSNKKEAQEIISEEKDLEMLAMAKEELENAILKLEGLEEEIRLMLIPKDPDDAKNVVMEFRAGTGGDEASIFAGDLFRLYTKFCDQKGWKTSVVDMSEGTSGGFKEIIIDISGENVYGTLKYESGVHRVQRVPQTETQGRVHTSAATVMVLPEAEDVDIQLDMSEIRVERTTSTGPGGQSVNTTY
ncbi:MAG: PCRF domain-containing protein, partial [Bacteroidota bacterium]|nr:PCRF domain-containing protein [Bacteroidota bacterium]